MKNLIIIFTALFLMGFSNNLFSQTKTTDAFSVKVDGLGCPYCAFGLEKQFKKLKGIKNIKIDIETGMLDFEYPAKKALSLTEVEEQVKKGGYTPVRVVIKRADGTMEPNVGAHSGIDAMATISFSVAGNCGMCKSRIEAAAMEVAGVQFAKWDKLTQELTVKADKSVVPADIETAIAQSGHDTKNKKAEDGVYGQLPECCRYKRNE